MFSMRGKTVLVTGATGHLGEAMVAALAEAGAHCLVNGVNKERVKNFVERLNSRGWSAEAMAFDITHMNEAAPVLARLSGRPLHALINNAYAGGGGSLITSESQAYRDSYEVSVVAAHYLLQNLRSSLRAAVEQSGDASVINIASMYAMVSPDQRVYDSPAATNPPFYGAAKAALLQWTRYAACELGTEGIRVNSISPGPFPSGVEQTKNPQFVAKLRAKVPMGRIGSSSELKGPVLFLASSASSYVNGTNLVVDGGWTAW